MGIMAFDENLEDKAKKDEEAQQGQPEAGQPITTSTAEVGGGQQMGSEDAGPGPGAPKQTTGKFANLGQYLKANQGAGAGMADKIIGDKDTQAKQYGETIASEGASLLEKTKTPKIFDQSKKASEYDRDTTKDFLSGSYQGPTSYENVEAQRSLSDINKEATLGQTLAGQQTLLKKNLGQQRSDYGAGSQALDSILLGRDQQATDRFKGLQELTKSGLDTYDTVQEQVGTAGTAAAEDYAANQQALKTTLGSQADDLARQIRMAEMGRQQEAERMVKDASQAIASINSNRLVNNGVFERNEINEPHVQALEQLLGRSVTGLSDLGRQTGGGFTEVSRGDQLNRQEIKDKRSKDEIAASLQAAISTDNPLYGRGVSAEQSAEVAALRDLLGGGLNQSLSTLDPSRTQVYDEQAQQQALMNTLSKYFNFGPAASAATSTGGSAQAGGPAQQTTMPQITV